MIASEGFGTFDDFGPETTEAGGGAADRRKSFKAHDYDIGDYTGPGKSSRVLLRPMLGLFNQEKLLSLRFCPLSIKLELVKNAAGCVHTGAPRDTATTDGDNWSINDVHCK